MLLRRNFTGMLIPVNYAAWGLPGREAFLLLFFRFLQIPKSLKAE
jgi:hypothetical protein